MGGGTVFAGHATVEKVEELPDEDENIAIDIEDDLVGLVGGEGEDYGGDAAEEVRQGEGVGIPEIGDDLAIEGQEWAVELINNLLIELYSTLSEQELREKERRQRAGIEAAKERGVYKGRKPIDIDLEKVGKIYPRWKAGHIKTSEFREMLGHDGVPIKPNTFYRSIERYEADLM